MTASRSKKAFGGGSLIPLLLVPLSLALLLIGSALADTKNWIGEVGSWKVGGNWDSLGVPLKGDSVFIKNLGDPGDPRQPGNL